MLLLWLFALLIASVQSSNKLCPESSFSCPDTATCCELADKSYGCCPLKNAVCCDDHIHCCPSDTKCEVTGCIRNDKLNVTDKQLLKQNKIGKCGLPEYICPDSFTCCKTTESSTYDCCPLEHAVCCHDGHHCCPEGTICDLKKEKCRGKGFVSEMYNFLKARIRKHDFSKFLPLNKLINATNIICPDSSFTCPNGYTCCKLLSGSWGCCPFVKATCCEDHQHCCPEDMQCDSSSHSCFRGQMHVPSLLKEPPKFINAGIRCPDNSTCAESMTCCELNNKHFGCCPYYNAVCCEDHSHCCPQDYVCDIISRNCIPKQKGL